MKRDYLDSDFVGAYATIKRAEQDRFGALVTALAHDGYLHNA